VQAKTQEAQELEEAIYGQPAPNPNDIRQAIEDERQYGHELRMSLGRAKAELENIEAAETQRGELGKELEPLATDAVRWQTLVRAFGKDGVPAMIIEHAVPDLEYQANDILGQMTRGKNQLYFNTQRDRRNGPGVIETLDIMITDGETPEGRPYETYSGGEQLRIDFALRIALSEMLARRAGSKVEWLTIDEGIGSQDSIHRALVLEAIRNISDRFQTVILITHIEEAQAMFDDIINI
jgi:exonuclease SbcC